MVDNSVAQFGLEEGNIGSGGGVMIRGVMGRRQKNNDREVRVVI